MLPSTWYRVSGTKHREPSVSYQRLTKYLVLGRRCLTPSHGQQFLTPTMCHYSIWWRQLAFRTSDQALDSKRCEGSKCNKHLTPAAWHRNLFQRLHIRGFVSPCWTLACVGDVSVWGVMENKNRHITTQAYGTFCGGKGPQQPSIQSLCGKLRRKVKLKKTKTQKLSSKRRAWKDAPPKLS